MSFLTSPALDEFQSRRCNRAEKAVTHHERMLRAWHFAILRFAVTFDNADRLNVLAIAYELDRPDRKERQREFHFFRRTSAELCLAILNHDETGPAVLRSYLAQIDDHRLKQALAAAVGIFETNVAPARRRPKQSESLFKGLPPRKVQA
jgi:hypothetical protein